MAVATATLSHDEVTRVAPHPDFPWLASTYGRPHQISGSAWRRGYGTVDGVTPSGILHKSCAFEMGLGTGKTLLVLEEVLKLLEKQPKSQVLVLAPNATIRTVWKDQAHQHAPSLKVEVLDGPVAERIQRLKNGYANIWVHNHEALSLTADALIAKKFDLIVIDEHSKYRNPESERCKVLLGRGKWRKRPLTAPFRMILSGTPIIKRATDLYCPYRWLGAEEFQITKVQFTNTYVVLGGFGGRQDMGIRRGMVPVLNRILDEHRYVVPAKAVNMPEPVFHVREIEMPTWQEELYRRVQEELLLRFEDESEPIVNPLSLYLRLAQVTSGFEPFDQNRYTWHDDNAKSDYLFDDLLPDLMEEDPKVIIWGWFRPEIAELYRMAKERGYSPVTYYGGNTAKMNDDAVREFQFGKANLFVANYGAAGLGLNLGASRSMIYHGRSFDTELWMQSLARNRRLDSVAGIRNVIILQATRPGRRSNTLDHTIAEVLRRDVTQAAMISSINPREILA